MPMPVHWSLAAVSDLCFHSPPWNIFIWMRCTYTFACGSLTRCHYLIQLEAQAEHQGLIRNEGTVTAVLPEELSAEAPLFPAFNPARPCKTLQHPGRRAAHRPVFIKGSILCNISIASRQLLTADSYPCIILEMTSQEIQRWREETG